MNDKVTKSCTRCGLEKPLEGFTRKARNSDGYNSICRICDRTRAMEIQLNNPGRRERDLAISREWHARNREKAKERLQKWYLENKGTVKDRASKWRSANPEKSKASQRKSLDKWKSAPGNAELLRKRKSASMRGPARRMGRQIWGVLRDKKCGRRWIDLLWYGKDELRAHLERQFAKGMSWDNYGKWHVDHIIPLASFTITGSDDPELRRAWALTNLRPLWAKDNLSKSCRIQTLL